MSVVRPKSLQGQLALRLGLLFLAATGLAVGALLLETRNVAEELGEENLVERAEALGAVVVQGTGGAITLDLRGDMATFYAAPSQTAMFAVRDRNGRMIAASSPDIAALAGDRPLAGDEPRFFRLDSFGLASQDYYGLDLQVDSPAGPLSVTVAQSGDADALLHAMLREFLSDVAWIIPLFVAATLLVGVVAVRAGLKPLRRVSGQAAHIAPEAISTRLPGDGLPSEVVPLVTAVNRAFDRLEEGFAQQRRFTANAAHELRTPLAIITGALEAIEGDGELAKLRNDVARMNRLVEQLLHVARLDNITLDVSADIDLAAIAAEVAEYMAPIAIAQGRSIALSGADRLIPVRGNRHAIADALRNLIENAIAHAPIQTEISVEVNEGCISVSDHGPGVGANDQAHIFDRFWRSKDRRGAGAGLGLAIVRETMKAHGGIVEFEESPGGGARFILRFAS